MSVVTSRPEGVLVSYGTHSRQNNVAVPNYKASPYTISIPPAPSRNMPSVSTSSSHSRPTNPTFPRSSYRAFHGPISKPERSNSVFKRLPQGIFDCILNQLQSLHAGSYQSGCLTCFQRDLYALAMSSRAWEKAVRSKLYNRIHILGNDSPAQLKRYRLKRGSRLKLLRRTLRERKLLANLVLELRVPEMDAASIAIGKQNAQWQDYRDLVASVVMVCPNLERLLGFTVSYHHEFDRLTYALSTRKKLKEHAWIIGDFSDTVERSRSQSPPGMLEQQQAFEFLNYHVAWPNLETLMLHSLNMNGVLEHGIFLRLFNRLPSLRHLCISSFHQESFTDRTLLFLPPLESLRLENLQGVTDTGLAQYTSRREAQNLKTLTLVEQNIQSLLIISKILASLRVLQRFSIVQTSTCPTLPTESMVFQPLLASPSLKYLHWDVASPDPANALSKLDSAPFIKPLKQSDSPNSHLAQSILHAGFPYLAFLRAPSDVDPPGVLQAVCQPVKNGQALIPSDRYSLPRSSRGSVNVRPLALPGGNNLTSARIRAQTFIDMAARDTETGMKFVITDCSDSYRPDSPPSDLGSDLDVDEVGIRLFSGDSDIPVKVQEFRMPAIMGNIGPSKHSGDTSIPRFILRSDITGADADGGLLGWRHLLASSQVLQPIAGASANQAFARNGSGYGSAMDEPVSPVSTSRFTGWGSFGGRQSTSSNSSSPPTSMSFSSSSSAAPLWARDVCNGSWNQGHPNGKEWWFHVERDRPGSVDIIDFSQFFTNFARIS
ncbi:hypothetical protein Egran_00539 [Elaphomyces granulatus]|uniref:F-box domain-containing protein n=1 Tax=Elaphomyces granulatus TaxID=519963 RepID=A0A232M5J3_9EURO|nr:hypothetical protein Egran_00539 [Elaphomyces granulatus]